MIMLIPRGNNNVIKGGNGGPAFEITFVASPSHLEAIGSALVKPVRSDLNYSIAGICYAEYWCWKVIHCQYHAQLHRSLMDRYIHFNTDLFIEF